VRCRARCTSGPTNVVSGNLIVFGSISHLNCPWERKPLKEVAHNG
jgi:hypothetical protein